MVKVTGVTVHFTHCLIPTSAVWQHSWYNFPVTLTSYHTFEIFEIIGQKEDKDLMSVFSY